MLLSKIIAEIAVDEHAGPPDGEVTAVCYDSRSCVPGALFCAIRGLRQDGHAFLPDAVARGARFVLHEQPFAPPPGVTALRVADSRRSLGIAARVFFGDPSARLCLIGVVGTNGKTTVTYLLEKILQAAGHAPGVIGTVNYRYGNRTLPAPTTTPESLDLQRILHAMGEAGVTHAVMEVSSHAIALQRVDACAFDVGIFTNLSQDHLDYHHSMENYYETKKRFFTEILPSGHKRTHTVINGDDAWGRRLLRELPGEAVTFSLEGAGTVTARQAIFSEAGVQAEVRSGDTSFAVASSLLGRHNLANILAASAACLCLDIPGPAIRTGIADLASVPGRLERIGGPGGPRVFVDYAHTDDALRHVLQNLAPFRRTRIITVFGCGGDRDKGKRPLMGKTATTLSDVTLLTSDNPRSEDPLAILGDIEKGIEKTLPRWSPGSLPPQPGEKGYAVVPDRREAIRAALAMADDEDIVLIAGKGHEPYQWIGQERIPFDDRLAAAEILRELRSARHR